MKVSFCLPQSSSTNNPNPNPNPFDNLENFTDSSLEADFNRVYVTEFDPSQNSISEHAPKKIVIAPLKNEWDPTRFVENPILFEVDSSSGAQLGSETPFGLNLRQQVFNGEGNSHVYNSIEANLLKKLKTDLEILPEVEGFDQFDEVPVEDFGAALLAGYGWKQGMGIGRNAKEDTKLREIKRWNARYGLGFVPDSRVSAKITANGVLNK